jgi:hypothetical protein
LVSVIRDEGDILILCDTHKVLTALILVVFHLIWKKLLYNYLQSVMWSFLCNLLDISVGIIKSLRNFLKF